MTGARFDSLDEIVTIADGCTRLTVASRPAEGIFLLPERWNRVIEIAENYFEGFY